MCIYVEHAILVYTRNLGSKDLEHNHVNHFIQWHHMYLIGDIRPQVSVNAKYFQSSNASR